MSADLERLASLVGVPGRYTDAFGHDVAVDDDRRAGILRHLGYPAEGPGDLADSLVRAEARRARLVPFLVVAESGRASEVALGGDASGIAGWRLTDEAGRIREGRSEIRRAGERSVLRLPVLPPGYHGLAVTVGRDTVEATLVAAPPRCWQPGWIRDGRKAWGLAAQIYSLRSGGNLGIGSYADVGTAAADAGSLGAAFVGLSPVHALFESDRTKISPYSPSSRLMLETLHIDPRAVPGFGGSRAATLLDDEGRAARIAALRAAPLVDHPGVWAELSPVLEALWAGRREADEAGFEAFRREGGALLQDHAVFEALSAQCRQDGAAWVGDWPEALRDSRSAAVREFADAHPEQVAYHAWLQFQADRQLAAAAAAARRSGMSVGLYRDLAVGSDSGGSEVWSTPERFAATLSIGAPPDLLAPNGQDWGLPPLHPLALEETGLAAFRDLVRANMRHAGAIRIDHAFQLARLYLIPSGEGGSRGAYVAYPFEAMLAVLRLESHRSRCLVIAEDLGTGPAGFSDAIMRSGLLSYRVLPFERTPDGGFVRPDAYPVEALSVMTTHDLPTFAGWWRGLDTDLRLMLGTYDAARAEAERADRVTDRARLAEALCAERLLPSAEAPDAPPVEAALRYLARTRSALNAVQYEDVVGSLNQPNMPGTTEGHPNWRRKLEADLETIAAPGGPLPRVASAIGSEARGHLTAVNPLAAPPPRATYRFQFHKDFTFDDAAAVVPYLVKLGISHVYASPIAKARPGSTHGYDIVDHDSINPELGGEEAFVRLSETLKAHGLGLVVDIVPNHLGVGGADNGWWLSTLEWGQLSPHAAVFDIDWERLGAGGKLVVPVLGDRYGVALEKGDLVLKFDAEEGAFAVWHFEHKLPLSPLSYPLVLDRALAALDELGGHAELIAVSERLRAMAEEPNAERRAGFPAEAETLKARLAAAVGDSAELRRALERAVAVVNGVPGLAESFGTLHRIIEQQAFRPAHWRVAASDINYRRFFDINSLAGIRVEDPAVFAASHALVFRLVREGRIQGLRIDHVDGLADPEGYLQALQGEVGPGFYVVVEKILEPGEALRPWPVAGTTGYDVLNVIDGVLVDAVAKDALTRIDRAFTGTDASYGERLREAKHEVLEGSFASELEVLTSDLKRIADADRRTRDYTVFAMRIALAEIVARFPVYRSYVTTDNPSADDVTLIEDTIAAAQKTSRLPDRSLHDFVGAALLGRIETEGPGRPTREHVARFRRRFQQLTGPVMAKSLEDTLFYRFPRLLALNEVGGDPGHVGLSVAAFHAQNADRARSWPAAMIATATHDTKRGEDARARLLALSERPDAWAAALDAFAELAAPHLATVDGEAAPDRTDLSILLQGLLGAWPLALLERDDAGELETFRTRFLGFVEKALREAKRHSSWVNPNEAYEGAAKGLVEAVLTPGSPALDRLRPFARDLAEAGMRNALARTVLKYTLPGVPDTYQGTTFWDFSLVDPDNRRPVDYAALDRALADEAPMADLARAWPDGRVKQRITARLLRDRADAPALYADGDYRPVGEEIGGIVAFTRTLGEERLVTVASRLGLEARDEAVRLALPAGSWRDILAGRTLTVGEGGAALRELFGDLPVAVLRRTA